MRIHATALIAATLLLTAAECDGRGPGYVPSPCVVSDGGIPDDLIDNTVEQDLTLMRQELELVVPTTDGVRLCRPGLTEGCEARLNESCVVDLGSVLIGDAATVTVLTANESFGARPLIEAAFVDGCSEVTIDLDSDDDGRSFVHLHYAPTRRAACRGELVMRSSAPNVNGEISLPLHGDAIRHQGPSRP